MKYEDAKDKFIQGWGSLGSNWGINRTMAQIHALLLVSPSPLSTEDVMENLKVSRGNAHSNLRELINWGIVKKEIIPGDRKDFFSAEKDIWKVSMQVIKERRKREIEPLLKLLNELKDIQTDPSKPEEKELHKAVTEISDVLGKADNMVDKLSRANDNWFLGSIMKLMK